MILILVLGGGFGWVVRRARIQRDAVVAIRDAGGLVTYDWGWKDGRPGPPGATSRWPKWLIKAFGADFFDTVTLVNLNGVRVYKGNDPLMDQVGQLENLDLNGSEAITDAGLVHFRRLTQLRDLDLGSTSATGAGLQHLAGMTRLKRLILPPGPIADADLVHLKGMTDLEWLETSSQPNLTDAGLTHLEGLVSLKTLAITSPTITSEGLMHLRNMKRLENLFLDESGVTDLAPIRYLASLELLSLHGSSIVDAGLADVQDLKGLNDLDLTATKVTDAGLVHIAGLTNLNEWVTRRYPKKVRDDDSDVYEIPALYLQKGPTKLLLDPISYDIPGAEGAVDIYLMLAYDTTAYLMFEGEEWVLYQTFPPNPRGPYSETPARSLPMNAETINQVLDSIAEHAVHSI